MAWFEWPASRREEAIALAALIELVQDSAHHCFLPFPLPPDAEAGEIDVHKGVTRIEEDQLLGWAAPLCEFAYVAPLVFRLCPPQLVIASFDEKPLANDVLTAFKTETGAPARQLLFFDNNVLVHRIQAT